MKQVVLLILLFFCIPSGLAQESAGHDPLVQRLEAFGRTIPQEKVYVHMDNTTYFLGDTIWFSAYTRQTDTGTPSRVSRVLYAELLNNDGYLVERKLIEMKDGRGNGFFALSEPLLYSGFYELRAYTRWQLNWGQCEFWHGNESKKWFLTETMEKEFFRDFEKLYSRVFVVYDRPKDQEHPERNMTSRIMRRYYKNDMDLEERKLQLTLYPEGGNLVAGVENRVAFEAAWNDGEWLEGYLHFGGDSVPAVHRGRGVFTVTPEKGMEREVLFRTRDGQDISASLPKAEEGVALQVRRTEDACRIRIQASGTLSPDSLALTVMREGVLKEYKRIDSTFQEFILAEDTLEAGVHQTTVFDTQGRVYADRLFFVRKKEVEKANLQVEGLREEYAPYERMELSVSGQKSSTPISVSIRDGYMHETLYDNASIMAEMLLSSEIRGFVPDPGWYFEEDDENRRQGLDLLMQTQGWRRFKWRDMAVKGEWELTEPAEKAQVVTGRLYRYDTENTVRYSRAFYEKALKRESKVHAELVHPQTGEVVVGEQETDSSRFRIQLPRFYGHAVFFLSASDTTKWKKGGEYTWVQMEYDEEDLPAKQQKRYYVAPREFYIRMYRPYPRFVKPYGHYQDHLKASSDTLSLPPGILSDGTTLMREVSVRAHKRGGERKFDNSQPAFSMDAYEVYNDVMDAGLLSEKLVRVYMADYGLEYPYKTTIKSTDNNPVYRNENERNPTNIFYMYGLGQTRRSLPQYVGIPKDSIYTFKYLKAFLKDINDMSPGERRDYNRLCKLDRYVFYSDYCPRLSGSKRYEGSNLPETRVAIYPYPDGSRRVTYRDRRYVLPGFSYPAEFYSPDYSRQTPPDSVKDYRRTLYWNPNLMLDENGKATVTLYNCSRTTRPVVTTAGQAADGTLLWNE